MKIWSVRFDFVPIPFLQHDGEECHPIYIYKMRTGHLFSRRQTIAYDQLIYCMIFRAPSRPTMCFSYIASLISRLAVYFRLQEYLYQSDMHRVHPFYTHILLLDTNAQLCSGIICHTFTLASDHFKLNSRIVSAFFFFNSPHTSVPNDFHLRDVRVVCTHCVSILNVVTSFMRA